MTDANKNLEKDLHQMKNELTNVEACVANVEADSLAVKKANFIADLMVPR